MIDIQGALIWFVAVILLNLFFAYILIPRLIILILRKKGKSDEFIINFLVSKGMKVPLKLLMKEMIR